MLSRETLAQVDRYRAQFEHAKPFPHVAIDGFLEPDIAEQLYRDFPAFRPERALNEHGTVGTNCCINDIWTLGPNFKRVHDYFQSAQFLDGLSLITGIPDLIADPELHGGGTHDNQDGHELDPHLDFNIADDLHRRLNVLIYMNKGWSEEWGGAIELFENGRDTLNSPHRSYNCEFNRSVIFETSERSWHGFRKIRLPAEEKHRSRRLISLYYYTRTRPDWRDVTHRATFFCPYFPERLQDPRPLNDGDRGELVEAIQKRDRWLQFYQEREIAVRKSYGYVAPGDEVNGTSRRRRSVGLSDPALPNALEQVSFGWLVKQVTRIFFVKSRSKLKRVLSSKA